MIQQRSHLHQLKVIQTYHNVIIKVNVIIKIKVKLKVKLSLKQNSLKIKHY